MKLGVATTLLMSSLFSPAWAGDLTLPSQIDSVTVYPAGADVVRAGTVALPVGETRLVLDALPGGVDPQSIRVEAQGEDGLVINSVDTKVVDLPSTSASAEMAALQAKVQKLTDERQALDQAISDAKAQKELLLALANRQVAPGAAEGVKAVDAAGLDGILNLVGTKLAALSKTLLDAQVRQRDIDAAVADLQVQIEAAAPEPVQKLQVSVNVIAAQAGAGMFKIKYRVAEAGWNAFYDAKLSLPGKETPARVMLVRRAEVHQATTENWSNVALTLSTARPGGMTAAPDLAEALLDSGDRRDKAKADFGLAGNAVAPELDAAAQNEMQDAPVSPGPAAKPARQNEAVMNVAGFNAQYAITGRVDIDNSGQAKKVRIGSDAVEAKLSDVVVPRLDPVAYLTATLQATGADPLLPGVVNLYRDEVYVGQGGIEQTAPGEDFKLGFGADDLVKVKRQEVKRNGGETGLFSTNMTRSLAWTIAVQNLHDTAFPVVVVDRVPVSTHDQISVQPVSDATPPTDDHYLLKRGVKAWALNIDPKQEKTITVGYVVSVPKGWVLPATD